MLFFIYIKMIQEIKSKIKRLSFVHMKTMQRNQPGNTARQARSVVRTKCILVSRCPVAKRNPSHGKMVKPAFSVVGGVGSRSTTLIPSSSSSYALGGRWYHMMVVESATHKEEGRGSKLRKKATKESLHGRSIKAAKRPLG